MGADTREGRAAACEDGDQGARCNGESTAAAWEDESDRSGESAAAAATAYKSRRKEYRSEKMKHSVSEDIARATDPMSRANIVPTWPPSLHTHSLALRQKSPKFPEQSSLYKFPPLAPQQAPAEMAEWLGHNSKSTAAPTLILSHLSPLAFDFMDVCHRDLEGLS